jgi:sodium pump decarboxylase gamma subunit
MGEVLLASAMGFMIVFLVLVFLALVITVFAKVLNATSGKKQAAPAAAPAAPAVPEKDDSEIVAIVTSVICEELGADPSELCISGIREV